MEKKLERFSANVCIWEGLADVGPDTEFVGNAVTIRTTDGRSYSARVDIPRGDPALPLTDDELLEKYRDCARSQLRSDDIERSAGFVLGLEMVADIGTLMATLRAPTATLENGCVVLAQSLSHLGPHVGRLVSLRSCDPCANAIRT